MRRIRVLAVVVCVLALIVSPVFAGEVGKMTPAKEAAIKWLDGHAKVGVDVATYIWNNPELGLGEHKSSAALQELMKAAGFKVETGVAGMKTAFVATFGEGKPVLGIHAEFDALPGISQVAGMATPKAVVEGCPGHGCGHNVFGTYSCMAAIAIKNAMETAGVKGTIKLYGTPSEETLVGKAFFVKEGIYKDADAVLSWHPGTENAVSYASSLAMDNFKVRFHGKASHASSAPWAGRSALDAIELMNIGMNYMREHVRPESRIMYSIPDGGKAPNVVPPYAEVWYFIRSPQYKGVEEIVKWAKKVAEGAALMTETKMEFVPIVGVWQYLPNQVLAKVGFANATLVGVPPFTDEDEKIAEPFSKSLKVEKGPFLSREFQKFDYDKPFVWSTGGGSIDEANTSWVVPMVRFSATTLAAGTPGHSWQSVAQNILPPAFKGGLTVAKYMAATALDLYADPKILEDAKAELKASNEKHGPFVDPVKDVPLPTFQLMHNVQESQVPVQTKDMPLPDLSTLKK